MASTHTSLHYHILFSTKNREPWFTPSVRPKLHSYLGGIVRGLDGLPHACGGVGDHVHVFIGLGSKHQLANVVRVLKTDSSKWVKGELDLAGFAWQEGYGAFTVSAPDLERVRKYVLNQEEHHKKRSFQDEYVNMLKRGLVAYKEEHLW